MTKEKFIDGVKKSVMSVMAGAAIALFTFYLTRKASGQDKLEEVLNSKLDKTEFRDYKNDHQIQHESENEKMKEIKDHIDTRFEDLKDFILNSN